MNSFKKLLYAALMMLLFNTSLAFAALTPPGNLTINHGYLLGDTNNPYSIKLSWTDTNTNIDGYKVYYKLIEEDTVHTYQLLATTTDTEISFNPSDDLKIVTNVYSFYVTAYKNKKESDKSNIVSSVLGRPFEGDISSMFESYMVTIISTPEPDGEVGMEYTYDVSIMQDEAEIKYFDVSYSLSSKPEGMSIDSETGHISWTPQTDGNFKVEIIVESENNVTSNQVFNLKVNYMTDVIDPSYTESQYAYPNPAVSDINFKLNDYSGKAHYTILDINGKVHLQGVLNGETELLVNTQPLSSGSYFFTLDVYGKNVQLIPFIIKK